MAETLVAVDAPHFYAGLVMVDDIVIDAAPILKWTRGRSRVWLREYFRSKGWKVFVVNQG